MCFYDTQLFCSIENRYSIHTTKKQFIALFTYIYCIYLKITPYTICSKILYESYFFKYLLIDFVNLNNSAKILATLTCVIVSNNRLLLCNNKKRTAILFHYPCSK